MYTMGFRVKIVNTREKHGKEKTFSSCKKATNRMFLVVFGEEGYTFNRTNFTVFFSLPPPSGHSSSCCCFGCPIHIFTLNIFIAARGVKFFGRIVHLQYT